MANGGLDDLGFLVGRWRGEGTLRGNAATSQSSCAALPDGSLRLDVETLRGGEVVHRERVTFREGPDGRVVAETSPGPGVPQAWEVSRDGARLVLRHPGFVWEIAPEGRDAYAEAFDAVGASARRERIVTLRHLREGDGDGARVCAVKNHEWDLKRCLRCAAWIPRPATVCAYCGTSSPDVHIDVRPARNALGLPRSVTATRVLIGANVALFLWSLFVQYTWTPGENPLRILLTGEGFRHGLSACGWYEHRRVVEFGETWRLVSATFLHGGLIHIAFNLFALRNLGTAAEEILGPTKFLAVYLVSGICSTLAIGIWFSLLLGRPAAEISPMVGASGAIFGVGGFLATFLLRRGTDAGRRMGASLGRDLVLMLALGFFLEFVSNTGHVGGLLPGVLFGWTLRDAFSTRISPASRRNWFLLAVVLAVISAAALVRAVAFSFQNLGAG